MAAGPPRATTLSPQPTCRWRRCPRCCRSSTRRCARASSLRSPRATPPPRPTRYAAPRLAPQPSEPLDTTTTHRLPASVLFRGRRGCACLMHSSSNTAPALRRAAASPQPRHHQLHAMPVHASPCTLQRATGLAARRRAYRCTRTRASSPSPSRSTTRASTRAAAPGSARSAWPSTRAPRGRRARTLVTARDPR